jgi:hypothetical protein
MQLSVLFDLRQKEILGFAQGKLFSFRKNYQWHDILQSLITNRLMYVMSALKQTTRLTCDNRESFLSCFIFEPTLSSLPAIF